MDEIFQNAINTALVVEFSAAFKKNGTYKPLTKGEGSLPATPELKTFIDDVGFKVLVIPTVVGAVVVHKDHDQNWIAEVPPALRDLFGEQVSGAIDEIAFEMLVGGEETDHIGLRLHRLLAAMQPHFEGVFKEKRAEIIREAVAAKPGETDTTLL